MHLLSSLMRTLLILGLLVAPVATVATMPRRVRRSGTDGLGRCACGRGSTRAGDQCRSFRRWAMPAFWSSRLVSLRFRKSECSIVESLMWVTWLAG